MPSKYYLPHLTNAEVAEAARQQRVLLLPLGTVESNGPHQLTGCDFLLTEALAEAVAERTPAIRMPTLHYGVSELHAGLPGTFALPEPLFRELLETLLREASRNGFSRVLVLNCHRHNHQSVEILARTLRRDSGQLIAVIDPLETVKEIAGALFAGDPPAATGHGGEPLISLIAHLHPEEVRMDLAPSPDLASFQGLLTRSSTRMKFQDGAVGMFPLAEEINPSGAWADLRHVDPARGQQAFDKLVGFISDFIPVFARMAPSRPS